MSSTPDPIVVVPYRAEWPARFHELARPMRDALGDTALRIDHIGSTSVPGLDAKPIIDIQVSVAALEPTDRLRAPLEGLGYVFRSANPDRTKRYFREPVGTPRTHVHVRAAGSWPEQLALLHRDFLRAHPDAAAAYAGLKRGLAQRYRADRNAYMLAKDPLIWEHIRQASDWSQEAGWHPGRSDA